MRSGAGCMCAASASKLASVLASPLERCGWWLEAAKRRRVEETLLEYSRGAGGRLEEMVLGCSRGVGGRVEGTVLEYSRGDGGRVEGTRGDRSTLDRSRWAN